MSRIIWMTPKCFDNVSRDFVFNIND
jgi:hypothetical protein